jgi:hypothetical protein
VSRIQRLLGQTREQQDRQMAEDLFQAAASLSRLASQYATWAAIRRMSFTEPEQRYLQGNQLRDLSASMGTLLVGLRDRREALLYLWTERMYGEEAAAILLAVIENGDAS